MGRTYGRNWRLIAKLIERYENDMRDKNPEDSQQVVEEIEEDYGMVNHERQY